jgi:hypothetical protein
MQSLQNLIPDPTTKNLWQCRPAAILLTGLAAAAKSGFSSGFSSGFGGTGSFSTANNITATLVSGTRVYGMFSNAATGTDEPFCYDVPTNTYITISGVTAANTPTTPPTVGPWNPPTMTIVGAYIIVSHPGFNQANGFFGVINVNNPYALTWESANTLVNPLVFPPQWVENFNGRCFFFVNPPQGQPGAYMSDSLNALQITNANQILTFGDNTPLTCASGLGLNNLVTGGVTQALLVFKGVSGIYQVTGDYALGNLAVNSLNVATGTFAPLSVTSTEEGLLFMAPDGIRSINTSAAISDPIGKDGQGVTTPFFFALTPSRSCASYNGGVYRVQVQNGIIPGSPQQEWWYDFSRDLWSGPHTTNVSLIVAYQNTFIVTIQGAGATLWQSDQLQSLTSTFVENGQQLFWTWASSFLPDTDQMAEVQIVESTIHMQLAPAQTVAAEAVKQDGTIVDIVSVSSSGFTVPTLWGQFDWGQADWYGSTSGAGGSTALYPRQLAWHYPIVFRRGSIQATGNSVPGFKIGRMHMRYEITGYLQGVA